MLAPADNGKYKLMTVCKDSHCVAKRFVNRSSDRKLGWVESAEEATPVDLNSDYVMSDAGKAVMSMHM